ncbi:hypothetical protein OC835_005168 [Tilletia horrida]|nr:hypothetical protein OC835_005168 [Tilletia horrida]
MGQANAESTTLNFDDFHCSLLNASDKPVQLYAVKAEGRQVECFAEATEGEKFAVRIEYIPAPGTYDSGQYRTDVYMAGSWMGGRVQSTPGWSCTMRDREVGENLLQNFMFRKPILTDEAEGSLRDPTEIAALGEVEMRIQKVLSTMPIPKFYASEEAPAKKEIYERAKKVGAVGLGVGETVRGTTSANSVQTFPDRSFESISFRFKCTTAMGLELMKHAKESKAAQPQSSSASTGGGNGNNGEGSSAGASRRRRREDEEEDVIALELEEARLRQELKRVEQRKAASQKATAGSSSSQAAGSSASGRRESPIIVKADPAAFDRSLKGGSADDPLEIDDSDDD